MAKPTSQLDLFVPHAYHGQTIEQRAKDGYINATAMCDAAGRPWSRYWKNRSARDFTEALSADLGIPISGLSDDTVRKHLKDASELLPPPTAPERKGGQ